MLTFDFICISVPMTTERKAFLILLVKVCQWCSFGWDRPTWVMVWASLEDIRWTAGSAFFLWTTRWGVHGANGWTERVPSVFFFFLYYSLKECDCDAFMFPLLLCWQNWVHLTVCELFLYLFSKRTFDSSVLSAMSWGASEAGNGFNMTRAGVWTLLIDELRFIATRVAA